jgi:hypothetical protein
MHLHIKLVMFKHHISHYIFSGQRYIPTYQKISELYSCIWKILLSHIPTEPTKQDV